LLGEVLCELPGVIEKVILTGKAAFASAARQVVEAGAIKQPLTKPKFFALADDGARAESGPPDLAWPSDPASVGTPAAQRPNPDAADAIVPGPEAVPNSRAPKTGAAVKSAPKAGQPDAESKAHGAKRGGCACCGSAAAAQAMEPGMPKAKAKAQTKAAAEKAPGPAPKTPGAQAAAAEAKAPGPVSKAQGAQATAAAAKAPGPVAKAQGAQAKAAAVKAPTPALAEPAAKAPAPTVAGSAAKASAQQR